MRLTNREIRRQMQALEKLATRVLPSIRSDLRLAALIRRFYGPAYQVTEDARMKIFREFPADPETGEPSVSTIELRQAKFEEVQNEEQEIPDVPEDLLITEKDLPVALKGSDGELNRKGLADIIASLGDLYQEK